MYNIQLLFVRRTNRNDLLCLSNVHLGQLGISKINELKIQHDNARHNSIIIHYTLHIHKYFIDD